MNTEQARKKKQHWTKEEKETLLHEVEQRRSIVFATTHATKHREWGIVRENNNLIAKASDRS